MKKRAKKNLLNKSRLKLRMTTVLLTRSDWSAGMMRHVTPTSERSGITQKLMEKLCVSALSWAQISKPADWRSPKEPAGEEIGTRWRHPVTQRKIITSSDYFWERQQEDMVLLFCPICGGLLKVGNGSAVQRMECLTCPYIHNIM